MLFDFIIAWAQDNYCALFSASFRPKSSFDDRQLISFDT
jgi:hypothetical protein